ncbi:hypothetical protein S7335_3654 [Synechococcus sp. PCC 7335]|nr:hypothetical protein S7335_3654 [Synechococcus sp. PCC 7335]
MSWLSSAFTKALKVFCWAQFGQPIAMASGKLRSPIDDAFHAEDKLPKSTKNEPCYDGH